MSSTQRPSPEDIPPPLEADLLIDPLSWRILQELWGTDIPTLRGPRIDSSKARLPVPYPETTGNIADPPPPGAAAEALSWWLKPKIVLATQQRLDALRQARDTAKTESASMLAARALKRIKSCHRNVMVLTKRTPSDDARDVLTIAPPCNHRSCPACAISRSAERANKALTVTIPRAKAGRLTHMVLTIPNCPLGILETTLARLRRAWVRLWGRHKGRKPPLPPFGDVDGALYTIEVTLSKDHTSWHPHIHCLIDSPFVDQDTANHSWRRACDYADITITSVNVWLERVKDKGKGFEKAIVEATKYPYKPTSLSDAPPLALAEWLQAMHHRRAHDSWGTLKVPPLAGPTRGTPEYNQAISLSKFLKDHPDSRRAAKVRKQLLDNPLLLAAALRRIRAEDLSAPADRQNL